MLKTHRWDKPFPTESDSNPIELLAAPTAKELFTSSGLLKTVPNTEPFPWKTYARVRGWTYVTHLLPTDVPQAFSQVPPAHYRLGNPILATNTMQPVDDIETLSVDNKDLPEFLKLSNLLELVDYVDASHATDLHTRRSVTGLLFCLAGGAIAFKSKLQPTIATSSTES
jgi:hypothetical protein